MKKVIVTGSMGFVGLNLANRLHNKGYDVIGVDNLSTNTPEYYIEQFKRKEWEKQHIKKISDLHRPIFENVDTVYHLGAKARVQNSIDNSYEYMNNNIVSTAFITAMCHKYKCKLIFISSSSVSSENKLSPYSESKLICENIVRSLQGSKIIRLFNVYGYNMPEDGDNSTLVGRINKALKENTNITLYGNGEKKRDFTFVSQVVDSLIKIGENKTFPFSEKIELGTGKPVSIIDVLKASKVKYNIEPDKDYESKETKANITTYLNYNFEMSQLIEDFWK